MSGNHETTLKDRGTRSRVPFTQNISGVSAETGGRVFAGYLDNSSNSEYYGGTHYHQHPERPETPPRSSSTVPFRRDPDFVDRGTLLDQIHEKGSIPGSRIGLLGLGGVGKSQIAIEYCHRVRDQSPETWVFWIHASNATRFEQCCRDLADRLKIPRRHDPKVNVFKLLRDWLHDETNGKWVLILDNLDDEQSLYVSPPVVEENPRKDQSDMLERSIRAYFPQSLNGLIIMTSRSRRVVSHMVEDSDVFLVEPMSKPHAVILFDKKLGVQASREDVIQLTAALEFMPLAIVQAAAYIKQRFPRISVRQYLESFQRSDHEKTSLLSYEGGHLRRDPEAKNSILITWQISFDHILQESSSAANMLSLMSFFDRQGIPDDLLRKDTNMNHRTGDDNNSADSVDTSVVNNFEDDILVLRDYSLISISEDGTTFEMHRLIQLAMQEWLKVYGQLEMWRGRFVRILYRNFPACILENWPRCRLLFAHVQNIVSHQPEEEEEVLLVKWASLLYEAAWFAWTQGELVNSLRMAQATTIARMKLFGPDDKETLNSFEILGLVYSLRGQWKEAEGLQFQVMETRKKVWGPWHLETLESMSNLASTYCAQGRWKEVEDLEVQVMETCKQVLGLEHPHTLRSIGNLASTYSAQGRWREAEDLEVQATETSKKVLGLEHPNTLRSMSNLASTYHKQGRWKEAEDLEVQVMEMHKQILRLGHPDTLDSMANLASTYCAQGRWKEAEDLEVQVMETCKQVLGLEHPHTLRSIRNLASTYSAQGRWKEAEDLKLQAMKLHKQVLGPEHPDTLISMSNLATTYHEQRRWKEAEDLQVQVVETSKKILGLEHPQTLSCMNNLASTYWDQGRWKEAEDLEVQVVETRMQILGPEHPDTLRSMKNLAYTLKSSGQVKAALILMTKWVRLRDQKSGPDHPDTIASMFTLQVWRGEGASLSSQSRQVPGLFDANEGQTQTSSTETTNIAGE